MFDEIRELLARFLREPGMREAVEELEAEWAPPPPLDPEPCIRKWLEECGLSKGRDEDVAFYVDAYRDGNLNSRDVRKRGVALTASEKRDLGVQFRGILTHEFVETLNADGLADPVAAAQIIATPARTRCATARDLLTHAHVGLKSQLMTSNGAAGACAAASALDGKTFAPSAAPALPMPACTHPDQCFCMYRGALRA